MKALRLLHLLRRYSEGVRIKEVTRPFISKEETEIRLFAIMRNESLRLPYFLSYYKNLGVDRFFLIDNASEDDSVSIAIQEKNVHLFITESSYEHHWYWMEFLINKYGLNHWCIVVDIDELFSYPYSEIIKLPTLIKYMEYEGSTAIKSTLLDMYSECNVSEISYCKGDNPLKYLCHFNKEINVVDSIFFDKKKWQAFEFKTYMGGVRDIVCKTKMPNYLSKISLIKFDNNTYLTQGMHAINNAILSNIEAVTFHTKFLQDFLAEVTIESIREQHWDSAIVYKIFSKYISRGDFNLFNSTSIFFKNTEQLVELGIMKITNSYTTFIQSKIG